MLCGLPYRDAGTAIQLLLLFFFLYWGHCECLASRVGPVRVLSAVVFL